MTVQVCDEINFLGNSFITTADPFKKYLDSLSKKVNFKPAFSNNWRGYRAKWEVIDNKLYLYHLTGTVGSGRMSIEQMRKHKARTSFRALMSNMTLTINEIPSIDLETGELTFSYIESEHPKQSYGLEILHQIEINDIFKNVKTHIFADWFTGTIRINSRAIAGSTNTIMFFLKFINGCLYDIESAGSN